MPGSVTVLMRALECRDSDHRRRQQAAADFCFHLPVGGFGLVDFQQVEAILAAGYAYAREGVAAIPESVAREVP